MTFADWSRDWFSENTARTLVERKGSPRSGMRPGKCRTRSKTPGSSPGHFALSKQTVYLET